MTSQYRRRYGQPMRNRQETLRTNITGIDVIAILAAGVLGAVQGSVGTAVLCGAAMATAIGVWRGVRFLGKLLEYAQLQAGVYDDESQG